MLVGSQSKIELAATSIELTSIPCICRTGNLLIHEPECQKTPSCDQRAFNKDAGDKATHCVFCALEKSAIEAEVVDAMDAN